MNKVKCLKYPNYKCKYCEDGTFEICEFCIHNLYHNIKQWQSTQDYFHKIDSTSLSIVAEGIEKQIPQKPKEHYNWCDFSKEERLENSHWFCKKCDGEIEENQKYCCECGQKIDWS